MEEDNGIITLIDDETGKEIDFDLVCTFDYEGKRYAAMFPIEQIEGVEEDEIVLLEIVKNGKNEAYRPIENDVYREEVFNEFLEIFDELAESEDGEE